MESKLLNTLNLLGIANLPHDRPEYRPSPTIIEPTKGFSTDWKEVWAYRELFCFFALRDLKTRYKQTVLGMLWAVIQPLASTFMLTFCFAKMAKIPSDGIPYPLLCFPATLVWILFSKAVLGASSSVIQNRKLVTRIYFPRVILPAASVLPHLVDFVLSFLVLVVMMLAYGFHLPLRLLVDVPALLLLTTLLALGVSFWLGAAYVRFRDVGYAMSYGLQLLMFATPIAYPLSIVPGRYRTLVLLNPLSGIVEGMRSALFDHAWNTSAMNASIVLTLVLLVTGFYFFQMQAKTFSDIL